MSMRYKGAVLSATAPTVSSSSAVGVWTMRQVLQSIGGTGWPTPPFISIGTPANFVSSWIISTSVVALSTTVGIIVYKDYTNDGLYGVITTLSGTTISYGTPVLISVGYTPYTISVAALTSSVAVVAYESVAGNKLAVRVLTVSGTTFSVGSEVINANLSQFPCLVALTSTTALCCTKTFATVISVSGGTPTINSEYTYPSGTGANSSIQVSALSSTSAVCLFDNYSSSNYPTALAMTISGTSITLGSNYTIESTGVSSGSGFCGIAAINSSGAIGTWTTSDNTLRSVAMTISGTTITAGSVSTIKNTAVYNGYANESMCKVNSNKALLVYSSSSAIVLSASGTTLTYSPEQTTNSGSRPSVAQMNGNICLSPYALSNTNGQAQVITVL